MSQPRTCPGCGAEIPTDSASGVCPYCALGAGLGTAQDTPAMSGPGSPLMGPEELAGFFPELGEFDLIGPGGMGTVYRARQRELGRSVAVKIMHRHLVAEPGFAERFNREARALARLDHPNIVRVYDGGHRDGLAYLVMELVEGVTLRQAMRSGGLEPRDALAMVPRICDALQYAHDHGVVHRDIKPENILLDADGSPKVADFGLAKLVGVAETRLTTDDLVMGTPHYMAPEQIEHPDRVDHRADIYAIGVVFYEMLTGELPVGRFPPPSDKAELDARLDEVVLRTLEKDPDRRYQRASELKSEVESLSGAGRTPATGSPGGAAPRGSPDPEASPAARPPAAARMLAAAAILLVAALVVAGALSLRRQPATPAGPPVTALAVMPFDDMSPGGDQDWLANGMAEELIENVSRIPELQVIARTSAFALQGQEIATISARLGVGSVVQGSVRRSGGDLRVTAQLIRAADGALIWSARYDRELSDVFAVQTEIARDIAEAIRSELGADEAPLYGDLPLGRYAPDDVRAYELLRKGIELGTFALTEEALREGSEYYHRALAIDPGYAEAHAMLGLHDCLLWLLGYDPGAERREQARAAAEKALEIQPTNSTAHQVMAILEINAGELAAAERRLLDALERHPQEGGLRMRYAELLAQTGRLEAALAQAQRAVRLDPLAPVRHVETANMYLIAGRLDAAAEAARRALELNPEQLGAGALLASAYHLSGRESEAMEQVIRDLPEAARALEGPMRQGFAEGGYSGMLRALTGQLTAWTGDRCAPDAGLAAHFHAIIGDEEAMYGCLDRVLAAGKAAGLYLKVQPVWEPYRQDPRFQAILAQAGLAG